MEEAIVGTQKNTVTHVSIKRIIRKSIPLMLMNTISIGGEFLNTYLLSDRGQSSLGASTLVFATNNFIVDSLTMLPNQNAVITSEMFGQREKLKEESSNSPEITELSHKIGVVLRQGWLLGIAVSIPGMAILFSIKPILEFLGQSPEISELVRQYFLPAAFAMPLQAILNINERLLPSVNLEAWLLPYKILLTLAGIGLNITLIQLYGIYGAGFALLAKCFIGVLMTTLFMAFKKELKELNIFNSKLDLKNQPYYKVMFKQGLPITFAQMGINGGGFGITLAIGHLGKLRLSIEKSALQYFGIITTVTHGINDAIYRLVAQTRGAKQYDLMRKYGNMGILGAAAFYALCATVTTIFALPLSSLFLKNVAYENEALIRYSFLLVAVGRLFSVLLESSTLNLAALQDTFLSSATTFLSTVALILPASMLAAYLSNLDIYGIGGIIAGGLMLSSGITTFFWNKQSSHAVTHNHFDTKEDTSNVKFGKLVRSIPFFKTSQNNETNKPVETERLVYENH